jgi:hypothetical protein
MTRALSLILAVLLLGMDGIVPVGLGGTGVGGGLGITIELEVNSFAEVTTEGGSIVCRAPCPVYFSATSTVVSGKTWQDLDFSWDFGDPASYTNDVGGTTWSLAEAHGFDAAHVYLPASYPDTCGGIAGRSHTVTARVTEESGGAKNASTTIVTICVQDPDAAWSGSKTTCYHDGTLGSGCPVGATDGGNVTANASTALSCTGDQRKLFKGGVTFSSTSVTYNSSACDGSISSYGVGQANFTYSGSNELFDLGTSNGGIRIHNITAQATGNVDSGLAGGSGRRGLFKNIALNTTNRFHGVYLSNPSFPTQAQDVFFDQMSGLICNTSPTQKNAFFITPLRFALLGSNIDWSGNDGNCEHGLRVRQGDHIVVDATNFPFQQYLPSARSVFTLRQNSAWYPDATQWIMISRSAIHANDSAPGSIAGTNNPDTPVIYDVWLDRNVFYSTNPSPGSFTGGYVTCNSGIGQDIQRVSFTRNYFNMTGAVGTADSARAVNCDAGGPNDVRGFNNVAVTTDSRTGATDFFQLTASSGAICENNVLYKQAGGSADVCTNYTQGSDSVTVTSDPFDFTVGNPAGGASVDIDEVKITNASVLEGAGVLTHLDEDAFGNPMPNGPPDTGGHEIAP